MSRIEMIKMLRADTSLGLKEAHQLVVEMYDKVAVHSTDIAYVLGEVNKQIALIRGLLTNKVSVSEEMYERLSKLVTHYLELIAKEKSEADLLQETKQVTPGVYKTTREWIEATRIPMVKSPDIEYKRTSPPSLQQLIDSRAAVEAIDDEEGGEVPSESEGYVSHIEPLDPNEWWDSTRGGYFDRQG